MARPCSGERRDSIRPSPHGWAERTVRAERAPLHVAGTSPERAADLAHLLDLVASGDLRVVSRSLPLAEISEAHRVVDSRRKGGNRVVTM
jgi:NADPH:quinone reductase-like Zn-dependent oxidoreductase